MCWKSVDSIESKIKDFFENYLKNSELDFVEVLDSAVYNNTVYLLVQYLEIDSPKVNDFIGSEPLTMGYKEVLVLNAQTALNKETGLRTWRYKFFREHQVKESFLCPKRMFDASNNMHPKAIAWRTECRKKQLELNQIRTKVRVKCKLIKNIDKGLVINTKSYGEIVFGYLLDSNATTIIGAMKNDLTKPIKFLTAQIDEEEFEKAIILNECVGMANDTQKFS